MDPFLRAFLVCEVGRTLRLRQRTLRTLDAVQPSRLGDEVEVIFVPRTDAGPAPSRRSLRRSLTTASTPSPIPPNARPRYGCACARSSGAWDEPADPRFRPRPVEIPCRWTTAVFPARVVIPADAPADSNTASARTSAPVEIDNAVAAYFAYTARALMPGSGSKKIC
ncbi:MAG: hypothetical protein R2856_32680 [Caldilineaceae bacterium]